MHLTVQYLCIFIILHLVEAAAVNKEHQPSCPLCHVLLGIDSRKKMTSEQMKQSKKTIELVDISYNSTSTDPLLPFPIPEFQSSNMTKSKTSAEAAERRVQHVQQILDKLTSLSSLLDRIVLKTKKYELLQKLASLNKHKNHEMDWANIYDYPISLTDDFLLATTQKSNSDHQTDADDVADNNQIIKSDRFNINKLTNLSSAKTIRQTSQTKETSSNNGDYNNLAPNRNIQIKSDFFRIF